MKLEDVINNKNPNPNSWYYGMYGFDIKNKRFLYYKYTYDNNYLDEGISLIIPITH